MKFDEERYTIFYNTTGNKSELPHDLLEIFKYINAPKTYLVKETSVELIKQMDAAVRFNQQNPEWRRNFEMMAMREMDAKIEGRMQSVGVLKLFRKGKSLEEISVEMDLPLNEVKGILHEFDED